MHEWWLLLTPVVLLLVVWTSSFVACDYFLVQGLEGINPHPVRLRLTSNRPISEAYFRFNIVGGEYLTDGPTSGFYVALTAGNSAVDSNLPTWRDFPSTYAHDHTPEFSEVTAPPTVGTGEFSVLIKKVPAPWNTFATWQLACDAYESANKGGTQYPYYDESQPLQGIVDLAADENNPAVVTFAFVLSKTDRRVIPDISGPGRPQVILHLSYSNVAAVITQVAFRIKLDGAPDVTLMLLAGNTFDDRTGFSDPVISADITTHNTQNDSGEWQATIKFPPLATWEVHCDAYKTDTKTKLPAIKFPGGAGRKLPVTGVDPQTPVQFNFTVNKPTGTVEPA